MMINSRRIVRGRGYNDDREKRNEKRKRGEIRAINVENVESR